MNADDLRAFEREVAERFKAKEIRGPIHLSGGNEDRLIEIFRDINPRDWVFSTYRSHYHALLHGIPRDRVMAEILAGRSMNLCFPDHCFFTSAIVGGMLPIAVGVAAGLKRVGSDRKVWCFVGDMAASGGAFHEAQRYAEGHDLPITLLIEDNGVSCDTPTGETWGPVWPGRKTRKYWYARKFPHVGVGEWVSF